MRNKSHNIVKESQHPSPMDTFKCKNNKRANKEVSQLIIEKTLNLVFGENSPWSNTVYWDKTDVDVVKTLIQDIGPQDYAEAMLASQFVALHLNGMKLIAQDNYNIMGQVLMMIRLSHQALDTLQRYRGKGQTINVNYNVLNQAGGILNTMVHGGQTKKGGIGHAVQDELQNPTTM